MTQKTQLYQLIPDYFKGFKWENIPKFSLITGKNAVGKSKLLKLIRYKMNHNNLDGVTLEFHQNQETLKYELNKIELNNSSTSNNKYEMKSYLVHFDGNFNDLKGESYVEGKRNQTDYKEVHFFKKQNEKISNNNDKIMQIKGLIEFILESRQETNEDQKLEYLNNKLKDEIFNPDVKISNSKEKIGSIKFSLSINLINNDILDYSIENDGKLNEENDGKLNVEIKLKQIIKSENFITSLDIEKSIDSIEEKYQVEKQGKIFKINQLSCGEQIILYFKLWSIIANDEDLKNKFKDNFGSILLLLEEPDSFLNPSILHSIVKIIKEDIVDKLDIQIMMTTHNPVTISFVEKLSSINNIFLLQLNQNLEIKKFKDTNELSKLIHYQLNSNMICIHQPYKIVFVEGTDNEFYNSLFKKFFKENYSNHKFKLIFRPVGKKNVGTSNCTEIENILKRVNEDDNLNKLIFGIRDRDALDEGQKNDKIKDYINLSILDRYEKENYTCDPLCVLFEIRKTNELKEILDDENDKTLENLDNSTGLLEFNEKYLNNLLKKFIDYIDKNSDPILADLQTKIKRKEMEQIKHLIEKIKESIKNGYETKKVEINFINSEKVSDKKEIEYPNIFLKEKGKLLAKIYESLFKYQPSDPIFIYKDINDIFVELLGI